MTTIVTVKASSEWDVEVVAAILSFKEPIINVFGRLEENWNEERSIVKAGTEQVWFIHSGAKIFEINELNEDHADRVKRVRDGNRLLGKS